MKKVTLLIIISFILVSVVPVKAMSIKELSLMVDLVKNKRMLYTSGEGYFCRSSRILNIVLNLERKGDYCVIESMVKLGNVKILPHGVRIRVVAFNTNCFHIIVKFGDSLRLNHWWTTIDAVTLEEYQRVKFRRIP